MKVGTAVCLERTARRFLDPERRSLFFAGTPFASQRKNRSANDFLGVRRSATPALKRRHAAEAREDVRRALTAQSVDTFRTPLLAALSRPKASIVDFISNPAALGACAREFRFPSSGAEGPLVRSRASAGPRRRRHEKAREHRARGLFETAGQSALRTPSALRRRRCWTGSSRGRARRHNRRRSRCARSRGRPRRLRGAGCPNRSPRPGR